ncbi:STAS domain-containing protein [Nocardia sp. NPDC005978]|uniref:STAS domain-containing protein n=1 Tax=Nocardia sp. NPDC005978 TaxID=3156725 RepID=UPI0033B0AF3D
MNETDPTQLLRVRVRTDGPAPVVTAVGEIDVLSAPLLEREIRRVLRDGSPTAVVDLSEVAFMGSAGLMVLSACASECAVPLRVVASPQVRRPLQVTGMDTMLRLHDTLADAFTCLTPREAGGDASAG